MEFPIMIFEGDQATINVLVIVLRIKRAELALVANDLQTMNRNDITRFCELCLREKVDLHNTFILECSYIKSVDFKK